MDADKMSNDLSNTEKKLNDIAKCATALMCRELEDCLEHVDLNDTMDRTDAYWFCVMLSVCDLTTRAIVKTPRNTWESYLSKFTNQMIANATEIRRRIGDTDDFPNNDSTG